MSFWTFFKNRMPCMMDGDSRETSKLCKSSKKHVMMNDLPTGQDSELITPQGVAAMNGIAKGIAAANGVLSVANRTKETASIIALRWVERGE